MHLLKVIDSLIIAEAATGCLRASPYNAMRRVSCECAHGVLFLRGRLSSFHHKQVAQETVARIDGVTQVVNEIEVTDRPGNKEALLRTE
jgi:osmotically-inducible protein OsmY